MDLDLPDLTNRKRPDARPPVSYGGLPYSNPMDSAIPNEPTEVDTTEADAVEADVPEEEVEEVPIEEGLTEAAAAPDFEQRDAEDEQEEPAATKRSGKKRRRNRLKVRI